MMPSFRGSQYKVIFLPAKKNDLYQSSGTLSRGHKSRISGVAVRVGKPPLHDADHFPPKKEFLV
jgi:hypothetical protein